MRTTPLYIPLADGLDLSKDAVLGGKDLTLAENVDFSIQGQVRGRPGRSAASQFIVRAPFAGAPGNVGTYSAAQSLASTGFRPNGLMRLKDGTAERAMLGTDGRLFTLETTEWKDRGAFASMRTDQPHTYASQLTSTLDRLIAAPDFGSCTLVAGNEGSMSLLNPTTLGFERRAGVSAVTGYGAGTMARCGTVTATLYRLATNALRIVLRSNGASTLTDVAIAADAAATTNDGDAPVICCDFDQTVFFVVYQTTTANQYKVLRINTAGTVLATFTSTLAGIHGHWVSNTSVAGNAVVVGLTNANGLTVKALNATTMADLAKDSVHGTAACAAKEVVVGVDSTSRVWWAYQQTAAGVAGLYVGYADPSAAASTALAKTYASFDSAGGALGVGFYTPMHQPIRLGGRMYLTVAGFTWPDATSPGVGTWFTLDLTNLRVGEAVGPFDAPTLVARGRTDGTALRGTSGTPKLQPESAVLLSDSTGWTFASIDWSTFQTAVTDATAGQQAFTVLNKISLSGPRCVVAGDATLFSGSVPRMLSGDQCFEAGFPALRPAMQLNPSNVGGVLAAGSYTVYACWVYTDGAGQVHRSGVTGLTQAVSGVGVSYIDVYVQTPYFTERPAGEVRLEVYSTAVNPASDDPAFLQSVVTPSTSAGATRYQLGITTGIVATTEGLYSLDGEFLHVTPNGDGGIAAVGRRVWMADHNTVYASLLLQPREGVAWNDEGSLSVALPGGTGRIMALEGLDDKLLVFCERGVWVVQDGGPSNTGVGPDIAYPIRLSDLGCAGPRSTAATDRGVVFCSPLDAQDPQRGGPWLLDRSLSLADQRYLGSPAMTYFTGDGSWVPEVAFSPERQQVYVTVPSADSEANSGMVVMDLRTSKWSTWSVYEPLVGTLRHVDVVGGVLWDCCTEPAGYTELPGHGTNDNVYLRVRTAHLYSDGRDGLGWGRVRAVSVLGAPDIDVSLSSGYVMVVYATQDQTYDSNSGSVSVVPPTADTTWPTSRTNPEWRLPQQKCSSIQITLESASHNARWSAIRLDVTPLPTRAPARTRI